MPKNKYKVNDRVRVKFINELKEIPGSGRVSDGGIQLPDGYWNSTMEKFCGMPARVIADYSANSNRYDLDITDNHYFSESMIKPLHEDELKDPRLFNEDLL